MYYLIIWPKYQQTFKRCFIEESIKGSFMKHFISDQLKKRNYTIVLYMWVHKIYNVAVSKKNFSISILKKLSKRVEII